MPTVFNPGTFATSTGTKWGGDMGRKPGKQQMTQGIELVIFWGQEDGRQAKNILHASYSGGFAGTVAQANSIMTGLSSGSNWTALAGFLHPTTSILAVGIRNLNVVDQAQIVSTIPGALGTATGSALPNEMSAVATIRTSNVGRANRGRIYLGGFATNALGTGNTIAAGAVTAITNWTGSIAGVLQGQGYVLGVGHLERVAYTSPITGVPFPDRASGVVPAITVTCRDNHWDSQRRRGLK